MIKMLMFLVILLYGITDTLTTYFGLQMGLQEGNPFVAYLLSYSFWLLIIMKISVLAIIYKTYHSVDFWVSLGARKDLTQAVVNAGMIFTIFIGFTATVSNILQGMRFII